MLVSLVGGDAPDDATVAFLLSAARAMKKDEEEEERRKREEELRADEKGESAEGMGRGGFVADQPQDPGRQYTVVR